VSSIGIDFGTTNSVLAQFVGGRAEAVPIDAPPGEWAELGFDRVLPSVYARGEDGGPRFGWAAKANQRLDRFEAVKRLLATEETVTMGGETFIVEEIAGLLFGAIKQGAAERGVDVRKAVVTVPANSRGLARLRTRICAGFAEIEVPILINEPTAAAMAYGLRSSADQNVLVIDWGGGTLDVTLLSIAEDVFVEQASKGVGRLGGIDIDRLVYQKLTEDMPDASSWTSEEVITALLAIELAKVRLSAAEEVSVELPRGQRREITRRRFNEWIGALVDRLLVPVRTVIAEGEAMGSTLDQVVLVGGSCNIPLVRERVSDLTGREPARGVNPMTAIAEGAAIAAAILDGAHDADFFVTTEHALGTSVLNPATGTLEFSEAILKRNQKLPASGTQTFVPVVDHQEGVELEVWEGDETKPLGDEENVRLAGWEVALVPRLRDEARIDLTYTYDVSGLLHVRAVDGVDGRILFEGDVQSLSGRDPRMLVAAGEKVRNALAGTPGLDDHPAADVPRELPSDVREIVERARRKVIPFVPDDEAASLGALVEALEVAAMDGDYGAARGALDDALRRHAYLF